MDEDIGKLFLEKTRYRNLSPSAQQLGGPQPPLEIEKATDQEVIRLPDPDLENNRTL